MRTALNFNDGWKWLDHDLEGMQTVFLDEAAAGFKEVTVPHSNAVISPTRSDGTEFRLVSWYRKHLHLDEVPAGQRVIIEFGASSTLSTLFVGGAFVAEHKGAYTPFRADITGFVKAGDNVIALKADARVHKDIPPEGNMTDYYIYGGLTRDVTLTFCNNVYSEFVFAYPLEHKNGAFIVSKPHIVNQSGETLSCGAKCVVYDGSGKQVAQSAAREIPLLPGSAADYLLENKIENPILWSLDNPYLYTVQTIATVNGRETDSLETKTGIRFVTWDKPDTDCGRIYLNGEAVKLRGINYHNTFPYTGGADIASLSRKDAHIIKDELGMNYVRVAHYPISPAFLEECDKIGLLVSEEAPGWQFVGDNDWRLLFQRMMAELVFRDRNHPCIFTWGVKVNESGTDDPAWYYMLNAMVKGMDSTRPTSCTDSGLSKAYVTDIYGMTDYSYGKRPDRQPWIMQEFNGHGPLTGDLTFALPNDSEFRKVDDLLGEAQMIEFMETDDRIGGYANWVLYDYLTPACEKQPWLRTYGKWLRCPGSYNALRAPKWNAWLYRSQREPAQVGDVLYIASEWGPDAYKDVHVLSNCDEAELFKGDISLGKIKPNCYTGLAHPIFKWENVTYDSGVSLRAVGYRSGKAVIERKRTAPGIARGIKLIKTNDGANAWVLAKLTDENGQRAFRADGMIGIEADGEVIMYENPMPAMDGYAGFYVKANPGQKQITVKAAAELGAAVRITDDEFCFDGNRFVIYGEVGPAGGVMTVSVDGGTPVDVSFYGMLPRENVAVYTSERLETAEHCVKLDRNTGRKDGASDGFDVHIACVKVFSGKGEISGAATFEV